MSDNLNWTTERRAYRDLLHQKRETFGQTKVESERATPRRLWQSIDSWTCAAVDVHRCVKTSSLFRREDRRSPCVHRSHCTAELCRRTITLRVFGFSRPHQWWRHRCHLQTFGQAVRHRPTSNESFEGQCGRAGAMNCSTGRCHPEFFHRISRLHSSPRYWRSRIWTHLMGSHIDLYRTSVSCQSWLSDLLSLGSWLTILTRGKLKLMPTLQSAYRTNHSTETALLKNKQNCSK